MDRRRANGSGVDDDTGSRFKTLLLEAAADGVQIADRRHLPADAQLGAPKAGPALDVAPLELPDVGVHELDGDHGTAECNIQRNRRIVTNDSYSKIARDRSAKADQKVTF